MNITYPIDRRMSVVDHLLVFVSIVPLASGYLDYAAVVWDLRPWVDVRLRCRRQICRSGAAGPVAWSRAAMLSLWGR